MTEVTAAAAQGDRYGRDRGRRGLSRRAKLLAVIAIAAAVVVAAVIAAWPKSTPTKPATVSYSVVDSATTQVSVAIYPDRERSVHCIVQATNDQEAIVGFTEVSVDADPDADPSSPRILDVDLATTQVAASGHVDACWFG